MVADPDSLPASRLDIGDIIGLLELCLSSTDFTFADRHHTTRDSGPIGLSVMVTLSQFWMGFTMTRAMAFAEERGVQKPQNLVIYMDDCFCTVKFGLPPPAALASAAPRGTPFGTPSLISRNF